MMDVPIVNLRSPRPRIAKSVAVLVLLAVIAVWRYFHSAPVVHEPYLASLIEIKSLLKKPEGSVYSQFGRDWEATERLRHDGDYETTGWVQADNQSGQLIRRNWMCVVHPQGGGHFFPVYVELGNLKVGTYTPDTP